MEYFDEEEKKYELPKGWHNHEGYRQIFCAALTGFIANKDFHGVYYQGSPEAAVEFAKEVVAVCSTTAIKE